MAFSDEQMLLFQSDSGVPTLTQVPLRPKSGFTYIFEDKEESKLGNWRADGYRWRQNAAKKFQWKGVVCKRYYFKLQIGPQRYSTVFSKQAISCPLFKNRTLIWYQGDDSIVVDFAHGNRTVNNVEKPFTRTAPSVLEALKQDNNKFPSQIYSDFLLAAPNELDRHITDAPRDLKQVRNAQCAARQSQRLSSDGTYNLVELASETGFINVIHVVPHLTIICFNEGTIPEFVPLLGREDLPYQCLSYDTTFDMGDFYLSVLTFRQTEFEETPVVPLLFMIHERRLESVHDFFFKRLVVLIPEITRCKRLVIVSDEETAIVNAIRNNLPEVPRFRCWIHALGNIKEKLRTLGISQRPEMKEYKNDFIDLLNQDSEAQYRAKLIELYISKWNKDFCNYFNKNIDPDMPNMGSWVLRPFGILLLTTNQSESFNCTMKRFGGWKRSPVDLMAISLMRLDKFFQIKIARGRYGLGEYTLKEDFVDIYPKQGVVLPAIISLEEIIARANGQKVDAPKENRDTEHLAIEPKKFVYIPSESAQERARNIIYENRIHLSAAHHVWNVTGSSGEEYTVRLFRDGTRRLTCTCAATTTCTHLLAAMYSIDCVMTQSKKPNTTAMRKKARKRPYKKGGKKKPGEVDNVKIKRARKDESLPFLHQELLDEEILCTEEPENNSMEESNINASSAKKMRLVSSPKSPNVDGRRLRRVKTRSVKPKNPIIDTPATVVPSGINAPSSCKESIIEISSKPDKITTASDKNECVIIDAKSEGQSLAASRQRRFKKAIDPRENRVICSAVIKNLKKTSWLCDDHIDYASLLLRKLNPLIGGLFNVDQGVKKYPKAACEKWVQLLHNGREQGGHWVCAAFGFSFFPPGQVVIYDSLSSSPNSLVVGSVASLIQTQETFFTLQLATASQQINHYDCGVYAIAFATALMFDTDPSKITFDSQNMRQHLIECFTRQNLTSFPSLNLLSPFQEKLPAQIVQVYCLCRRPLRFRLGKIPTKEEKMTQCELCDDCFHRSCLPSGEIFKVKKWRCQKCVNI